MRTKKTQALPKDGSEGEARSAGFASLLTSGFADIFSSFHYGVPVDTETPIEGVVLTSRPEFLHEDEKSEGKAYTFWKAST